MQRYKIELEGEMRIECESRMSLTEFMLAINDNREFIPIQEVGADIVIIPKSKILTIRTCEV